MWSLISRMQKEYLKYIHLLGDIGNVPSKIAGFISAALELIEASFAPGYVRFFS